MNGVHFQQTDKSLFRIFSPTLLVRRIYGGRTRLRDESESVFMAGLFVAPVYAWKYAFIKSHFHPIRCQTRWNSIGFGESAPKICKARTSKNGCRNFTRWIFDKINKVSGKSKKKFTAIEGKQVDSECENKSLDRESLSRVSGTKCTSVGWAGVYLKIHQMRRWGDFFWIHSKGKNCDGKRIKWGPSIKVGEGLFKPVDSIQLLYGESRIATQAKV